MTRYLLCLRTLLALCVVLAGVSASQAGLFGRWRACYDYTPASSPAAVSTPAQATIPPTGQPAASPTRPLPYTAAKPIVGDNAAATAVSAPRTGTYAPAPRAYSSGGWSINPRSSWDYGKFPPYN